MKKILSIILCLSLLTSFFLPNKVKAEEKGEITHISLNELEQEEGNAYLTTEVGFKFSILSDLRVYRGLSSRTGFIEKVDNLSFTSDNEEILKLEDKDLGIFHPLQSGTAKITISYPNLKDIVIDVTVVKEGTYDSSGAIRKKFKGIEKLYNTTISMEGVIDFYNKLTKIEFDEFIDKNDYILVSPYSYLSNLAWDKLVNFLKKNNVIYFSENPFRIKKISNVTKTSIYVTLSRKLNNADLVAYAYVNDVKLNKDAKMSFRTFFLDGKNGANNPYDANNVDIVSVNLKRGTNTFTVKLPKKITSKKVYSVVLSIDSYYGFSLTKGKYFTAK